METGLAEAIVDLVCERPVRDLSDAGAFVPLPSPRAVLAKPGYISVYS